MAAVPVQHRTASFGAVGSVALAFSNPVTLGNRVVVGITVFPSTITISTVVDNGTTPNSYNDDNPAIADATVGRLNIRSANAATNPSAGNLQVTVTFSGTAGGGDIFIQEVSGLSTAANAVDTTGTTTNLSGTATALACTTSSSTAAPGEYVVALFEVSGNPGTWAAGSGSTLDDSDQPNGAAIAHKTANSSGTGTETVNTVIGNGNSYLAQVVAYQLVVIPGAGIPQEGRPRSALRNFRALHRRRSTTWDIGGSTNLQFANAQADGIATVTVTLSQQADLAASASGLGTVTVGLSLAAATQATSSGVSTVTAGLGESVSLAASSAGLSVLMPALSRAAALSAIATAQGTLTPALGQSVALSVTSTGLGVVSVNLQVASGTQLAAVSVGVSSVTANLTLAVALAAPVSGVGGLAPSLSLAKALAAMSTGAGGVTAGLSTATLLALAMTASGVGQVSANVRLALALVSTASGQGALAALVVWAVSGSLAVRMDGTGKLAIAFMTGLRYRVDDLEPATSLSSAEPATSLTSAEPVGSVSTNVRGQ